MFPLPTFLLKSQILTKKKAVSYYLPHFFNTFSQYIANLFPMYKFSRSSQEREGTRGRKCSGSRAEDKPLPCQVAAWGQMGGPERTPFLGTPGNIRKREQLALLPFAEGEMSLSRCHMRFWSKENLPPLGAVAAFAGTLARRDALMLHVPAPLPWELPHVAPQIPIKCSACLYFMLC